VPDNVPRAIAAPLLKWYDAYARDLPWRARPAPTPADPYRVWLSEVMLQQTTGRQRDPLFREIHCALAKLRSAGGGGDAELMAAWAGLGYYARARNLLACARAVARRGALPDTEAELLRAARDRRYTAAAIAAIAFGRRAVVVDANVERVVTRLFALADPLPGARPRIRTLTDSITPDARAGDFAQAMMDLGSAHLHRRAIRAASSARCAGNATASPARYPERYPVKAAKRPKPQRYGTIFWARAGRPVLLVRRPAKGLLGGMRALPTGPWTDATRIGRGARRRRLARARRAVRHVFTHFRLELALAVCNNPGAADAPRANGGRSPGSSRRGCRPFS
jgi:A/G-specific adenine glycosylase